MIRFFVLLIAVAISSACSAEVMAANMDAFAGAWRGTISLSRPDGVRADLYLKVDVSAEGVMRLSVPQINLNAESSLVISGDRGHADVSFQGAGASAIITVNGEAGTFLLELPDRSHRGLLRRVDSSIDLENLAKWAGLYQMDDGSEVILSPASFTLTFHDLTNRTLGSFFPLSEREFFAGPGYQQPVPETRRLVLHESADGREIELIEGDARRRGSPSGLIELIPITFDSHGVTLTGAIIKPKGEHSDIPAAVVVPGSGRQNRYGFSALAFHRAVWLARQGMAALIFDWRGIGESGGAYEEITMDLLADDMEAASQFLSGQRYVDQQRVGLFVHSQSGIYAPLTVSRAQGIAFVIVLGATAVNGEIQEIVRTEQQMRADGWPDEDVNEAVAIQILKFYYANHRVGWDAYVATFHRVAGKPWFESVVGSTIDKNRHSWDFWRDGNGFEPGLYWAMVNVPVLAIFGDRDTITPVEQSIEVLERSFPGARRSLLTIIRKASACHDLVLCIDGGIFAENSASVMSDYLLDVRSWLAAIGILPRPNVQ